MLGATPTAITFSEVSGAFQRGLIDAAESPTNLAADFYEASSYYSEVNLRPSFAVIGARQDFWRELPYEVQVELSRFVREIGVETSDNVLAREEEFREQLRSKGVIFIHLTDVNYHGFAEAAEPIWEQVGGRVIEIGLLGNAIEILQRFRALHRVRGDDDLSNHEFKRTIVQFATDRLDEDISDPSFRFGSKRGNLVYGSAELHIMGDRAVGSDAVEDVIIDIFIWLTQKTFYCEQLVKAIC